MQETVNSTRGRAHATAARIYLLIDADRRQLFLTCRQKRPAQTLGDESRRNQTRWSSMSVCECACDLHELQQHGGSKSFTSSRRTVPWLHPRLVCEAFSSLPVGDGWVSCTYRDGGANAFSYLIEASSKNNPSNYGSTKLSCVLLWTLGQSGCAKKTTTTKKKIKTIQKKKLPKWRCWAVTRLQRRAQNPRRDSRS